MKLKVSYKPTFSFLILMVFTCVVYGQEITLIDFAQGGSQGQPTPGNWNNFTVQNALGTTLPLIDNTGASTGEVLTLSDVFDLYNINGWGTQTPGVSFGGVLLPPTASGDSFFGENATFSGSLQPTGGFTLSGLEVGKYYSFTIFASRMTSDPSNRETLYTITGNTTDTDTLNPANNINDTATISNIQPNSSGEITIQVEAGLNNDNSFGFYYLGAIEMTKISCLSTNTTTWASGAWTNGLPNSLTKSVILNDGYNTSTDGGSFRACSLTINAGFTLNVDDNTFVEVENDVINNGTLTVENHGAFIQNDDTSTFTGSGTSVVRKSTSILNNWYDYTYWSSPVSSLTMATSPLVDSNRVFGFNASNYLDVQQEIGNTNTFIAGSDDIDDNGDDWQYLNSTTPLTPGTGFAATHSQIGYIGPRSYGYDFTGPFNNGIYTTPIVYNALNTGGHWNFIGNPYPCALDFDAFIVANSGIVDGAAYLWSHSTPLSATTGGNQAFNFSQNDYIIIAAGSGSVNNSPGTVEDYIPSGQGFFIVGLANGNVTFSNSMRMADGTSNSQFFKSSSTKGKSNKIVTNKLWVNLTTDNGLFNQILVAYVDGATNGNDGMSYDAPRNLSSGVASIIYTSIEGENDKKFAIQGKDMNSLNENETISLGFFTTIESATVYKFSIDHLQGDFLSGNSVYLKDNLLNELHDLTTSDYTFTSETGEFNARFEIVFSAAALSTDDVTLSSKSLRIIELEDDNVQFTTSNNLNIKKVIIFDLLGRQLYNFKGQNSSETYTLSNLSSTIYIAKVELSNGAIITKKAFKK